MTALLVLVLYATTPNPAFIEDARTRWDGLAAPEVVSVHCGEDNAAYFPADDLVLMCDDLYDRPDLAVFVLNHEMGHSMVYTRGLPALNGRDGERMADELAFFMSTPEEVLSGARWFLDLARGTQSADDPHPAALDRAAALICLLDGREGGDRMCRAYYDALLSHWLRWVLVTE